MSGLLSPSFPLVPHHLLCVQWVPFLSVTEPAHCSICRSSSISGRPIPQHLSGLSSFFRDASPNQLLAFFLISCVPFLHLAFLLLDCTLYKYENHDALCTSLHLASWRTHEQKLRKYLWRKCCSDTSCPFLSILSYLVIHHFMFSFIQI